ncbi:MAG: class I SAM-dependent methyltransferase [Candidatus Omnitrophota bacterium]
MKKKTLKILDIGCGAQKTKGAIGIDIDKESDADIIHDLSVFPYPLKDSEFDQIVCKQVLEHLDKPLEVLKEIHRIAKPGALIIIEVPHFSCHYAFRSLHHKRFFSYFSLDTFLKKSGLFSMQERQITFHRTFRRWGLNRIFNRFPLGYERFWAFVCPAENLHFELRIIK